MSRPESKIIIQINSILKLGSEVNNTVVILDEISSLLRYLVNGNIENKEKVYHQFVRILKNAKKVLCIDGDLDKTSIDFIENIRGKPSYKILNTFKKSKDIVATIYENYSEFEKKYTEVTDSGQLTAVCSDTRTAIKQLEEKYHHLKFKSYHSDSKFSKEDLKDVNNKWADHHIWISPTVVTGIDYTHDAREVFVIINANSTGLGGTITPRDILQQIERFRKKTQVHVYINSVDKHFKYKTKEEFQNSIIAEFEEANLQLSPLLVKANDDELELNPTEFTKLFVDFGYQNHHTQANQNYFVSHFLEKKGYLLKWDDAEVEKLETSCNHSDITKELEALANGETPTHSLFETVKKRIEYLKIDPTEVLVKPMMKTQLECNHGFTRFINYCALLRDHLEIPKQTMFYHSISRQQKVFIKQLMNRMNLKITELVKFENPEFQLGDSPIKTEDENKYFKKIFDLKDKHGNSIKKDFKERTNLVPKLAKILDGMLKNCGSGNTGHILKVSKETTRVRVGGKQIRLHVIEYTGSNIIDLYQEMKQLMEIEQDEKGNGICKI